MREYYYGRCCARTHCRTAWAAPTSGWGPRQLIEVEELTAALEQDFARVVAHAARQPRRRELRPRKGARGRR